MSLSTSRRTELNLSDIKASTGLTYENFSKILDSASRLDKLTNEQFKYVMDTLYNSIRLSQWRATTVNLPAEPAYEIWNSMGSVRVVASKTTTELTATVANPLTSKTVQVGSGRVSMALFRSLEHAQNIIHGTLDRPAEADAADEEFFQPSEEQVKAREQLQQLDEMLSDGNGYSAKINEASEVEAVEIKEAYPEKFEPKLSQPTMSQERIIGRLKSLQGRILTIADATFADKAQREAAKTLINKEFRRDIEQIDRFFRLPDGGCETPEA